MSEDEFTIEIKSWKGLAVVAGIIILAFWIHHYTYYYNPNLEASINALTSEDPAIISQALMDIETLGMEKGHKLIPYILVLLGDERPVPEPIVSKMIRNIQSTPGAIGGFDAYLKPTQTIGFSAAMTLQSFLVIDLRKSGRISGNAREQIIYYVTETIGLDKDEYTISNALAAVWMMRDKRLLPFWFDSLAIDSQSIRIFALAGIKYYIYDRTHGLFTWHPEKEISAEMIENLIHCTEDPSAYVQRKARDIIQELRNAGWEL
ncbi:hypothetical protein [Desulfogranum japonicum]|uniref:hypothetical protein n=1 Tax=Desulfogranum japonicum TaxID=231447 RepID=UPI000403DB36|nr:hypothetical protein [Desulfogranum japonicum]